MKKVDIEMTMEPVDVFFTCAGCNKNIATHFLDVLDHVYGQQLEGSTMCCPECGEELEIDRVEIGSPY